MSSQSYLFSEQGKPLINTKTDHHWPVSLLAPQKMSLGLLKITLKGKQPNSFFVSSPPHVQHEPVWKS